MKFLRKEKGFTLIELLVVVAIIGILATVVLASLSTARLRAKDAAVTSAVSSFRTEIELNYPSGNYSSLCSGMIGYSDPSLQELSEYVQGQGGDIDSCDSSSTSYRIVAELPSSFAIGYTNNAYAQEEEEEEERDTRSREAFCINSLGAAQKVLISDIDELSSPACSLGEAMGSNVYERACGTYDAPSASGTFTSCVDRTNNAWVDTSFCAGLPAGACF